MAVLCRSYGVPNSNMYRAIVLSQATKSSFDSSLVAKKQRLEAVLFLSRQPLSTRRISQLAHLEDGTEARVMIKSLNERYDSVGRSFHIKRVAGGYQLLTRPQFFKWINKIRKSSPMIRLSQSAQETLTVVAYRQPIIKAEIETVRGVSCGEMLRQLLEKGLIKIAGRREDLGRPFLYATTKSFLTEFGFGTIEQLPQYSALAGQGLPDWDVQNDPSERSEDQENNPLCDSENDPQDQESGASGHR